MKTKNGAVSQQDVDKSNQKALVNTPKNSDKGTSGKRFK
jgi:hypothetical protein